MKKEKNTEIRINDKYHVVVDQYNYVLMKKAESPKTHKLVDSVVGYFPDMEHCLKAIRRTELTDCLETLTLESYLTKLAHLEKTIK